METPAAGRPEEGVDFMEKPAGKNSRTYPGIKHPAGRFF